MLTDLSICVHDNNQSQFQHRIVVVAFDCKQKYHEPFIWPSVPLYLRRKIADGVFQFSDVIRCHQIARQLSVTIIVRFDSIFRRRCRPVFFFAFGLTVAKYDFKSLLQQTS